MIYKRLNCHIQRGCVFDSKKTASNRKKFPGIAFTDHCAMEGVSLPISPLTCEEF